MKRNQESISMMPEADRPYEKCERSGPGALSDAELLAVILRSGTKDCSSVRLAGQILSLSRFRSGLAGLFHLSLQELCSVRGVGRVKAVQILCIAELSRRISRESVRTQLQINTPGTIAAYYMERLRHEEQELVLCMMLDTKNGLIGDVEISRGTVNISLISPRELFLKALSYHAVRIILIHNHPSGDASPSPEDADITERVAGAGELLGIPLLDHIIIGDNCYFSMREQQMLCPAI